MGDHDNHGEPAAGESRTVEEVTVTELDRRASRVIDRVLHGQVAVISKHGRPVAMIVPLADPGELVAADIDRSALDRLAELFKRRRFRREWAELIHGRWYGPRATRRRQLDNRLRPDY